MLKEIHVDDPQKYQSVSDAKAQYTRNAPLKQFQFSALNRSLKRDLGAKLQHFSVRVFFEITQLFQNSRIYGYIKIFLDADSQNTSCPSMYIMHIHIHMHIHIQIHIPYMGPGPAAARRAVPRPMLGQEHFQYFQDPGFLIWIEIQYFQDPGSSKWIEIQYFQDPGSLNEASGHSYKTYFARNGLIGQKYIL